VIVILEPCRRQIRKFPDELRMDLADALARLDEGETLAMPLSRPMPILGPRAHELRLRGPSGTYRVVYMLHAGARVYVVHAFKKTTRATAKRDLDIARRRMRIIPR
jgi:phage-related protein